MSKYVKPTLPAGQAYKILEEYNKNLMYIDDVLRNSSTTTNIELNRLGKAIFGDLFLGVFTSNEFPKYIKDGQMFIIKNKSSKSEGEHWSFIKSSKNKDHKSRLYGYDTFNRDIHKLSPCFRNKRSINANTNRDQSFSELNCGERSLRWIVSFYKQRDKVIDII